MEKFKTGLIKIFKWCMLSTLLALSIYSIDMYYHFSYSTINFKVGENYFYNIPETYRGNATITFVDRPLTFWIKSLYSKSMILGLYIPSHHSLYIYSKSNNWEQVVWHEVGHHIFQTQLTDDQKVIFKNNHYCKDDDIDECYAGWFEMSWLFEDIPYKLTEGLKDG